MPKTRKCDWLKTSKFSQIARGEGILEKLEKNAKPRESGRGNYEKTNMVH